MSGLMLGLSVLPFTLLPPIQRRDASLLGDLPNRPTMANEPLRKEKNHVTRQNLAAVIAAILALAGVALGAYGLYRSANAQNQLVTMQATMAADAETNQVVLSRLGVATLQPAQATDVANVARDPADVPPPITLSLIHISEPTRPH